MAVECSYVPGSIYHLTGYDPLHTPAILDVVKKLPCFQDLPCDGDIIIVGPGRNERYDAAVPVKTLSRVLVEFYRRLKLSGPGCQSILSSESQLVVVQLCLAEFSKQKYDIYDTDASEVFRMTQELNEGKLSDNRDENPPDEISSTLFPTSQSVRRLYQAFLASSNMLDVVDVLLQVKSLLEKNVDVAQSFRRRTRLIVLRWPTEPLERKILELLCGQTSAVTQIQVEMLDLGSTERSSSGEFRLEVHQREWETEWEDSSEDRSFPVLTPKTPRSPVNSSTETLVRQVFLSFLSLLVNSRDEISLARCLSYSPSGLDHKGFTVLKKTAKMKNMPMYQTAVSYITRLRLSRRGCTPSSEMTALADHVKSLGEFVTNVQQLHVLVEEVPDTRQSISKVLLSIKSILCKSRGTVFRQAAVEKVCQKLSSKFDVLLTAFDERNEGSPPRAVNQGGSILGRRTLKVILAFLDQEATSPAHQSSALGLLTDCTLTQATPVRMPSLLAQFRSPLVDNPKSPENLALRDRLIQPKEETKPSKILGYKSDMAWAELDRRKPLQERNTNIEGNAPSQATSQPRIKLWAETPPEKRHQARVFSHEFESPPARPTTSRGAIDHTPRRPRPKVGVAKMTEAALDKENLPATLGEASKAKGAGSTKRGEGVKRRAKRVLMEDTGCGQPSKKAKKGGAGGPKKKKQVALVKGQKTLNQFFRL